MTEERAAYDWSGRAIKQHRMELRGAFGFSWRRYLPAAARTGWSRRPQAPGQIARPVGKAASTFEERFRATTAGRLSAAARSRLDDLIAEDSGADEEGAGSGGTFFTGVKADPGSRGLHSLPAEVNELERVRGRRHPPELFADVPRS